jgi:predicted outer membrane protein
MIPFLPMKPNLFSGRARLVGALVVVAMISPSLSAGAAGPRVRQVSARSAVEPSAVDALRPAERAFLMQAVEDTRQQLRLAQVGVSQATSAEVRSHAQQLVADYRSLNTSLEALIRRKGGIAGAPVGGTSENYRKLVETTGNNFDWEFMRTVARKTDDVLTRFEQVVSQAGDEDIREFAAAQLPTLRAHRSEATKLTKALY